MYIPQVLTVIFHLPGNRKMLFIVYKETYNKIVGKVRTKGQLSGNNVHFFVKNPDDQRVQEAISIAEDGSFDTFI